MDTLTKAQRSALMSRIRGDSLGPETRLAAALAASGAGFNRNRKDLPGKPDFVLWPDAPHGCGRAAVFVHGCFWHGCPEHYRTPKTRSAHWDGHVAKNRCRDERVRRQLRRLGYRTAVVWEHDVKTDEDAARAAARLLRRLGLI